MAYHSFEELEVWKRACTLAAEVYDSLRESKEFSFRDQIVRSSLSISSNIAEGAERGTNPDFIRFLHYAKGSSAELRSQLIIAARVGIIPSETCQRLADEATELSRMLQGLVNALGKHS